MPFDFNRAFDKAEDFVRRHFKPKAVQEAEKRRRGRKARDFGRRVTRGVAVAGTSGASMIGYGAMVAPMGTAAIATAGAAALIATCAAMFWPSQGPRGVSRAELVALIGNAEEWLLEKRALLPGKALPALDVVFMRLHDLHPRVLDMDPHSTLAWDLRRLLGDHMPRLIHAYSELPDTVRSAEPDMLKRLTDGLATLDEELVRICREANRDHLVTFEAQERFIEIRYGEDDRLKHQ